MSSQLSTQEKFNRLNLNLKVKKIDANSLRALIVTNHLNEVSDSLSNCIGEVFIFLNDIDKKDLDYDKIIEWSINKSTSDNQIYEFFQELDDLLAIQNGAYSRYYLDLDDSARVYKEFIEYTYYWEKTNYFEANWLGSGAHPEDIPAFVEREFTRFGSDNPIKDEWRQVHFSEISQISDQLVILRKYFNDTNNLFDYNGRFLNEELFYCIESEDNSFWADEISIHLGDNNLVLLTAEGGGDYMFYLVEWTGNDFEFIEKLEEDSDIPKKYCHNDYTKVEELTKLFSTILKTKE
jgi:hypothetical protein